MNGQPEQNNSGYDAVPSPPLGDRFKPREMLHWALILLCLGAITFLSAEIASRVDDWLRYEAPLLSNPSEDSLSFDDYFGRRGQPNARYKKWSMNAYGFRGPEISLHPRSNTTRVMVIGASETFGLYESPGKEFPRQLDRALNLHGDYEVVNTAIVGMSTASMIPYFKHWLARFDPDLVVVYPSPQFYLASAAPKVAEHAVQPNKTAPLQRTSFQSRFLARLPDAIDYPAFIQKRRNAARVKEQLSGQSADWVWKEAPLERVALFTEHMTALLQLIAEHGAQPILCTHGMWTAHPPTAEDLQRLEDARVFLPRASGPAIAQFELLANQALIRLAAQNGWPLVDVDARLRDSLSEPSEMRTQPFADLVHFTDDGAEIAAQSIARLVLTLSHKQQPPGGTNE